MASSTAQCGYTLNPSPNRNPSPRPKLSATGPLPPSASIPSPPPKPTLAAAPHPQPRFPPQRPQKPNCQGRAKRGKGYWACYPAGRGSAAQNEAHQDAPGTGRGSASRRQAGGKSDLHSAPSGCSPFIWLPILSELRKCGVYWISKLGVHPWLVLAA